MGAIARGSVLERDHLPPRYGCAARARVALPMLSLVSVTLAVLLPAGSSVALLDRGIKITGAAEAVDEGSALSALERFDRELEPCIRYDRALDAGVDRSASIRWLVKGPKRSRRARLRLVLDAPSFRGDLLRLECVERAAEAIDPQRIGGAGAQVQYSFRLPIDGEAASAWRSRHLDPLVRLCDQLGQLSDRPWPLRFGLATGQAGEWEDVPEAFRKAARAAATMPVATPPDEIPEEVLRSLQAQGWDERSPDAISVLDVYAVEHGLVLECPHIPPAALTRSRLAVVGKAADDPLPDSLDSLAEPEGKRLAPRQVDDALRSARSKLRTCSSTDLIVTLRWTIEPSGLSDEVHVLRTSRADPAATQCVRDTIAGLRFPAAPGPAVVVRTVRLAK